MARANYEEPDSTNICQAISQPTQMQEFLHTDGPLVPVPIRATPIAIQNNRISEEDQQSTTAQYFGIPLITVTKHTWSSNWCSTWGGHSESPSRLHTTNFV